MESTTRQAIWTATRWLLIAGSVAVGLVMVAAAIFLGDCAAFGGRCPTEPPPLLDDDVFGIAAFGAAIMVGPTVFLLAPSTKRFWVAVGSAAFAAVVVGLLARSIAHG